MSRVDNDPVGVRSERLQLPKQTLDRSPGYSRSVDTRRPAGQDLHAGRTALQGLVDGFRSGEHFTDARRGRHTAAGSDLRPMQIGVHQNDAQRVTGQRCGQIEGQGRSAGALLSAGYDERARGSFANQIRWQAW
jgi:hypothetical protein